MIVFIAVDVSVLAIFSIIGLVFLGFSIKELSAFIVDKIHIVYPIFVAVLSLTMLIYYLTQKHSINSCKNPIEKNQKKLILDRKIIVFIINSPLVVLSPVSAIQSLATTIHLWGLGGFVTAFFMLFFYLISIYVILWLFLKASDWAEEKSLSFGRIKMLLVSTGFLILQYFFFIITQIGQNIK